MIALTTYYGKTKVLSYVCLIVPILVESLIAHSLPSVDIVELSLFCAISTILLLPLPKEDSMIAFWEAVLLVIVAFTLRLVKLRLEFIILFILLAIVVKLFKDVLKYFSKISRLMKKNMILYFMESDTRLMNGLILCVLGNCVLISKTVPWFAVPSILLLLALYITVIRLAKKHKSFLLKPNEEDQLRSSIAKDVKNNSKIEKNVEYQSYFDKVELLMKDEKLYLNRNLSINEVSRLLLTNKTKMSRVINRIYGDKYPNYIHNYRVKYSIELIKQNPYLKIEDIAYKSGYNSQSQFNRGFKIVTGTTPGKFLANVKYQRTKTEYLSNLQEGGP